MRFGATSLQLTSTLAKGLHRPKFRTDLTISKQTIRGEDTYVIKIRETETYRRYSALEYDLMSLCDGTRTPAEIAAALAEIHPDSQISEPEVADYLGASDPDLWERSLGEKNLAILEKIREERKSRVGQSNLLYFTLSNWDPDQALNKMHPYLRWMYTRGFVIFSILLFCVTAAILSSDWVRIRQDTAEFYNFAHKTAYDIWIFWVLLFVVGGIHEFGHGLTCKHFGGEVHHMGLLLIYFTPAFYTDTTEQYLFERVSDRQWVIFAGIWIELVTCGVSTMIWYFSLPGTFIGDLAYKMVLLSGVSGVFFNLNPLMKYDGYYALTQYLQIDNLREDSFEYLSAWVRRYILQRKIDLPAIGRRKRRIFLIFGTAAFLYSALVIVIVIGFVKNVFTSHYGDWGYLFTAGVAYLLLRKKLQGAIPAARSGLREAKEKFMAWKMTRGQQIGGLALLVLLVAVPTATKVNTEFILEPALRADVRAPVAGLVAEVPVREEEQVEAGAVLAVLRNPGLEAQAAVAARELDQADHALLAARAKNDMEEIGKRSLEVQRLETDLAESRKKANALVLRSPLRGVVTTPLLEQKIGSYLRAGDQFAVVADRTSMKARVLVHDLDLDDVRPGALVKLKVRADPLATYSGYVRQIMPAAAADQPIAEPPKLVRHGQELANYFAVVLEIPNSRAELREGMTGIAKIYGHRYPIIWRVGRAGWRWLRSQVW